ncbi:hypothetical protein [Luteococcus sp.]|uniref:hypothetical protein n=1 Tax=Luteococcus sp. TaxID=1969402 RepID=UPI003736394D
MSQKKSATTLASLAIAGLVVVGGASAALNANAESTGTASASPSSSSSATPGDGGADQRGPGHHEHTAVTGDALAKVEAAVAAKDKTITVTSVEADPDGSYDVHGTKDGKRVMVEVSKDLKTIEVRTGGPGEGGHGARGTEVTGSELTKVTEAVKAKDSAFTVEHVMKDSDGAYHVMGTKDGDRAGYEVSKDLKTITAHTMGDRGGRGRHGGPGMDGQQQDSPQASPAPSSEETPA